jgi:hypothetical protein
MRSGWITLVATLLLAGGAGVGASEAGFQYLPAADLIPLEGEGVAWQGEPMLYPGDRLFDYIDGGAPQFIEYGFIEVASQEIRYHDHTFIFDVYRMRDPLAAFGVFSVRRPATGTPLTRFTYGSATPYQCMLAYGPYYVEIAAYESGPEIAGEMDYLAQRGTAALDPSRAPRNLTETVLFDPFPRENRMLGTEKLARGPVSLRTALATTPAGAFRSANEAILTELYPVETSQQREPAPLWQVVSYHPVTDSTGTARALTTLVRLSGVADPKQLVEIAALAGAAKLGLTDLPNGMGWVAYSETEGHCFARLQGDQGLFLGSSRLPREAFMNWVLAFGNAPEER